MTQNYRFIYRTEAGDLVDVRHGCRPGDAENLARRIAKVVAKRFGEDMVTCIWMRPAEKRLPPQFIREVRGA